MNKKTITFVLLGSISKPIGGYKIIYEYANRLTPRGWNVNVIHPFVLEDKIKLSLLGKLIKEIQLIKHKYLGPLMPKRWFKFNNKVRILCVPDLREKNIPAADFIVACPVQSAAFVNGYSPHAGTKFYFIQHFEDWVLPKEEVEKTWKYKMNKIVIAKWLQQKAEQLGETSFYLPNGLDFSFFKVKKAFIQRPLKSICFMSHQQPWKGTPTVVEAMILLKNKYPDIIIKTFSVFPKPEKFPRFIEYNFNPSQKKLREIYNSSAIFISPSLSEGWPLPPAEAMMCGCVVIASNIGGHQEYVEEMKTGLYCIPGSVKSIIEKVEFVFKNNDIARKISHLAPEFLKKFDWDSRTELFEKALFTASEWNL